MVKIKEYSDIQNNLRSHRMRSLKELFSYEITPEYRKQLEDLADLLVTEERYPKAAQDLGQLSLIDLVEYTD